MAKSEAAAQDTVPSRDQVVAALRQILPDATAEHLPFVEITTDPDNIGSQRVIEANGGVLIDGYEPDPVYGVECKLRYRVALPVNVAGT